ncbi:MAG: DinB family protein [Acidobacteriota bacterium]
MREPDAFDLGEALEILRRTPATLDALLRGLGPGWHAVNEGPGTWSADDVVGHLIVGEETDWIPRARHILDGRGATPFKPFDRFAQDKLFEGWTLTRKLDRFAELRRENLEVLRGWRLSEAQLDLPGLHPALGAVTLRQLLATWTVHDLGHIGQISRVMAKRYGADAGPWREYLTVLSK